jgi:uncharacterized protein
MKLKEIFGFLLPEDRKFFPLFSNAADNLVLASELLIKLVRERDLALRPDYIRQIKDAELVGDDITRKLLNELDGTLITPFDREDIHELINKMDDIVDYIYSASTKINFYKISNLPEEFIRIADRIHSANKEIQNVLRSVRTANDFKKHALCNEKIREYEGQVDDIYQEFLSKLFDQEVNAIDLIKKRDILSSMEKAIDKCDDVGNIFASLIIKMG